MVQSPLYLGKHLVVAPALLLPDPTVDCLRIPFQPETAADLLRAVLAVDDEPSHGPFHLVGVLQVVSSCLHPSFEQGAIGTDGSLAYRSSSGSHGSLYLY